MRIFKYKTFIKWVKEDGITDQTLVEAVKEMELGLFDVSLGGGLYKKRISRRGQGKRGGYRVPLTFKHDKHVFFLYGFAKNQQENIDERERIAFIEVAKYLFSLDEREIMNSIKINELVEVNYGN